MAAAVEAFSGEDHSVAGYLLTEALDQQSPELVAFLETISVVDLVSADLAVALTGRQACAQVLADLAASHLFVQAVGRPGRWYRLHRLIADILRARPTSRRRQRDLQRRAAEWFRGNGMPLDAIRSAVVGELWPLAADLAGIHALALIMVGSGRALERVLARIPTAVLGVHPALAGRAGARPRRAGIRRPGGDVDRPRTSSRRHCLRSPGRTRACAARLERVRGSPGSQATGRRRWRSTVRMPVEPAALGALGMAGAEVVPVLAANNRGTAALWAGDLAAADRHLSAATDVNLNAVVLPQLNAMAYHALLRCERGELGPAEAAARHVITTATTAGLQMAVHVVGAYLTMVQVTVDRGDADEADAWLERIADVEAMTAEPHVRLAAAILLAVRREAAGDRETALGGLRAHGDLGGWRPPPGLRERWMLTEATLLARAGDAAAAAKLLERMGREHPRGRDRGGPGAPAARRPRSGDDRSGARPPG